MNIFNKYTLKTLKKNKIRTLVTIIGIILSASMFTAVTTFVSSLQSFLVNSVIANEGNWHGVVYDMSSEEFSKLQDSDEVLQFGTLQNIGYSLLEDSKNESKPFLAILGVDEGFEEMMPINLISGRMPENETELILPKHLQTNGGIKHQIGDVLQLSVGYREEDGVKLFQNDPFYYANSSESKEFIITEERSYTVVGFYERPSFEPYSAPGYSALTRTDNTALDSYSTYLRIDNPKNIFDFISDNYLNHNAEYNYDYLRFIGASNETSFNAVLYGLSYILIGIIMFASISLIYNAFSISVSERIKQFGLLSSIGATKKQLMRSVMFEASFLSCIGVPLGILAGITGIGITLKLTANLFMTTFINNISDTSITLKLEVTAASIAIAGVIGFLTILISAYLPARKAVRISNIEAIRQTNDINIKASSVKTSKLTYKLFGFEGMIASKNFKRNRRKYRATVFSLFVSVVIFITASSFCAYLEKSITTLVEPKSYDLTYYVHEDEDVSMNDVYRILSSTNGVTHSSYMFSKYADIRIPIVSLSNEFSEYYSKINGEEITNSNSSTMNTNAILVFVNDVDYEKYLDENGFDRSIYMNSSNPTGIALDFIKKYTNEGKYHTYRMLKNEKQTIAYNEFKDIEGYYYLGEDIDENGKSVHLYEKMTEDATDTEILSFPEEEVITTTELVIGATTDQVPFGVDAYTGDYLVIMYPYSFIPSVFGDDYVNSFTDFYFKANDHKLVFDSMYQTLEDRAISTVPLNNSAIRYETDRAMVIIVNVFSYGFIVLISLIAAANVFNTISTNINLRRREFAMLKSIGMTKKGFHKMMNYECLLYGLKGLLYGIPVSIVVTYFIYRVILNGWNASFFIPIQSIVIAIISVFLVVFSTMLYSMNRIKKENTIDALKNENL